MKNDLHTKLYHFNFIILIIDKITFNYLIYLI